MSIYQKCKPNFEPPPFIAYLQGEIGEARRNFELALADFRQIGDRRFECFAVWNLGLIARIEGRYIEGLAFLHEALALARMNQDQDSESKCLTNIALGFKILGDYDTATSYLDKAQDINRELGNRPGIAYWYTIAANVYHAQGRSLEALHFIEEGLAMTRAANTQEFLNEMLPLLGHIHFALSNYDAAKAAYKEALAVFDQLEDHQAVEPLAGLVQLHQIAGETDQAIAKIDTILETLSNKGITGLGEPFFVYLLCYEVLDANGDQRALDVLSTGYELLQKSAARIQDEVQRKSYLENVSINRKLEKLALLHLGQAEDQNGQ